MIASQDVKPVTDFEAFTGGGEDISDEEHETFLAWLGEVRRTGIYGQPRP
jgi:hypothetical protein